MNEWQPISTAPKADTGFRKAMFVVCGFGIQMRHSRYTTDPYCVWRDSDGGFVRWPHEFQPTHWMPLPQPPSEEPPGEPKAIDKAKDPLLASREKQKENE